MGVSDFEALLETLASSFWHLRGRPCDRIHMLIILIMPSSIITT